jgi:hypothetical protein
MQRQDDIDNKRDEAGKISVEKDVGLFIDMLKNKYNLIKGQTRLLKIIQKQMGRLLPWADNISERAAKILNQDQDKSFQVIMSLLGECVEGCSA